MDDDQEIIELLTNYYLTILERPPDQSGLKFYLDKIKRKEINIDLIPHIFKNSPRYTNLQKIKNFVPDKTLHNSSQNFIPLQVDDHIMYFNPEDKVVLDCFLDGTTYEPATTMAIKKILKKNMNVINIGANVGYYTLLTAKLVGSGGRIFAFEPFHSTTKILQKNVDANGYKNVNIINKACSNKTGSAELCVIGNSSPHHYVSFMKNGDTDRKKIQIQTITIDDFLKDIDTKINFVLIDAEGSEKYILEGMRKTIKKKPDLELIVEYNPISCSRVGIDGESFLNLIEDLGFSIYVLDDNTRTASMMTRKEVLEKYVKSVTNLYLTRNTNSIFKI